VAAVNTFYLICLRALVMYVNNDNDRSCSGTSLEDLSCAVLFFGRFKSSLGLSNPFNIISQYEPPQKSIVLWLLLSTKLVHDASRLMNGCRIEAGSARQRERESEREGGVNLQIRSVNRMREKGANFFASVENSWRQATYGKKCKSTPRMLTFVALSK